MAAKSRWHRYVGILTTAITTVALLAGCTPMDAPARPADTHDVGVELFSWNWDSIAAECETNLGPSGVAWVLTSPPSEHVVGTEWWRGYQPVSYLLDSRLGDRRSFSAMVTRCADVGVDVVTDLVINSMGGQDQPGTGFAGSPFEHYEYPGLYSDRNGDFTHCALTPGDEVVEYSVPAEVQTCELDNGADLATGSESVRVTIAAYVADLLSLGVVGFRIDAAGHIPASDVAAILDRLPRRPYVMQDVSRNIGDAVLPEDYLANGQVLESGFGRSLATLVRNGTLEELPSLGEDAGLVPSASARVFVDDHDSERGGETLGYRDGADHALATVAMLASRYGSPMLYSGYAFSDPDQGPPQDAAGAVTDADCTGGPRPVDGMVDGDWTCSHRDPAVQGMLGFRSAVGDDRVTGRESGDGFLAFSRGSRGFVALNSGDEPHTATVETTVPEGTYCDVIAGPRADGDESCPGGTLVVTGAGAVRVTVPAHGAVAIHVGSRL